MSVLLETAYGDITIDLFDDTSRQQLMAIQMFIENCRKKKYNNVKMRVQSEFAVFIAPSDQGQRVTIELPLISKQTHTRGAVAMSVAGRQMDGSFYIMLKEADYLDQQHVLIGKVVDESDIEVCDSQPKIQSGMHAVERINRLPLDAQGFPLQHVRIRHTIVLDDSCETMSEIVEVPSPIPTLDPLDAELIEYEEQQARDVNKDRSQTAIDSEVQAKETQNRAVVLEMLGDLPAADLRPPDNVLFVCKLNPLTQEDDLKIIFSQCGTVKSLQIIRDSKTKASLQYAFVEFETAAECEKAYFKMNNILVDDRRIRCDFSQSVAKLWRDFRHNKPSSRHVQKMQNRDPVIKRQKPEYDYVFDESNRKRDYRNFRKRSRSSDRHVREHTKSRDRREDGRHRPSGR